MDNRASTELENNRAALECGTLEVFLSQLQFQTPVFLTPLTFVAPMHSQHKHMYTVHVTAHPSPFSPILYATFHAAQAVRLGGKFTLTEPLCLHGYEAEARAHQLQQEWHDHLRHLLAAHPAVNSVVSPARLRLPETWIWSCHSHEPRIQYRDGQYHLVTVE